MGMTEWMCPRPARAVKVALEPSVGGSLRIDVEDSGFSVYVTGRFVELDRPQLPPEQVDGHQRGWGAVAVQLGDVLRARGTHPVRSDKKGS